jgi:hypothetical protein
MYSRRPARTAQQTLFNPGPVPGQPVRRIAVARGELLSNLRHRSVEENEFRMLAFACRSQPRWRIGCQIARFFSNARCAGRFSWS